MIAVSLAAAVAVPFLLGAGVLGLLLGGRRRHLASTAALGTLFGFGALAQWMLLLALVGAPLAAGTIGLPLAACAAICLGLALRRRARRAEPALAVPARRWDPVVLALLLYLLAYAAYAYWRALSFPEYAWDAIATAGLKAKSIYYNGDLRFIPRSNHPEYPLHVAFSQAWISMMLGRWDGQLPKIVFPLIATSYAVVQYAFVRQYTGARWAMLSVALLTLSPLFVHHATIGYADLATLCYNCSAILLLFTWFRTKRFRVLLLASAFSGFTSFVKLEGSCYVLCHFALLGAMLLLSRELSWPDRLKRLAAFGSIGVPIWAAYTLYKVTGWRVDVASDGVTLSRALQILRSFAENLFVSGNWSVVWILLALSLVRVKRLASRSYLWLMVATIFLFVAVYFAAALTTSNFVYLAGDRASTGLARVFLHFWGLVPVAVVLLSCPDREPPEADPLPTPTSSA